MKQVILLLIITLVGVSLLPTQQSKSATFANPSFQARWSVETADAVDTGLDVWGPEPLVWRYEPYAEAADGRRLVEYFDRGRMELTPAPDGSNRTIVTEGLLALEMTTGEIELGNSLLEPQTPPSITIDSGSPDDRIPTYASLSLVVQHPSVDMVGKGNMPVQWIDQRGVPETRPGPMTVTSGDYIKSTHQNVPSIFTNLFSQQPFGTSSWISVMGLPISPPFWTYYRRDHVALPSLIQVFERRILVYTPSLPQGSQFTVPNTGRHYYRWRYGSDPPRTWPNPTPGTLDSHISVPSGFRAGVVAEGLGTPVGLAIGPTGELWIATEEGNILRVDSWHDDGSANEITTVATGLPSPRGIVSSGKLVYVAVDDGIVKIPNRDVNAKGGAPSYLTHAIKPSPGSLGALVVDQRGNLYLTGTIKGSDKSVVAEVSPIGAITTLGTAPPSDRLGPVVLKRGQVMVAISAANVSTRLVDVPVGQSLPADRTAPDLTTQPSVVKFASGDQVSAALVFDNNLWVGNHIVSETIFASVVNRGAGTLVRVIPNGSGTLPELVEFATGLSNPQGIAVNLDGSLFVADAGHSRVIKITMTPKE